MLFSQFMRFEHAVVCAFCVGLVAGFMLFRQFVFGASERGLMREAASYTVVNLFALLQTWVVSVYLSVLFGSYMGVATAEAAGHGIGVMVPALSSYFGHRYFTFRK